MIAASLSAMSWIDLRIEHIAFGVSEHRAQPPGLSIGSIRVLLFEAELVLASEEFRRRHIHRSAAELSGHDISWMMDLSGWRSRWKRVGK
jgi:hypothetical protein